jgi:predicted GNAT superfamily acetyltransferase
MAISVLTRRVDDQITIRRAESVDDYRACQDAQRRAWGIKEEGYVIPVATMVGANLHGGLVLGAFLANGQAVAMSFGFLGRLDARLCLYSQLTGVVPDYQSHGLGYQLKLAQRDFARAEGVALIVWAFDPLQAGNARFNLHKLGARVRRYIDNMYGERTDVLNAGVPTDRLIAEWDLSEEPGPRVTLDAAATASLPRLIRTVQDPLGQGHLVPSSVESMLDSPRILLEIPFQIGDVRRDHPELAEGWRLGVRQAFEKAFAEGYHAIGFVREESMGGRRCYYVLERSGAPDGLRSL